MIARMAGHIGRGVISQQIRPTAWLTLLTLLLLLLPEAQAQVFRTNAILVARLGYGEADDARAILLDELMRTDSTIVISGKISLQGSGNGGLECTGFVNGRLTSA